MTTDIDINVFKEFARLEDPYECARYEAKLNILEPFKKQVYVGRIDPQNADHPIGPKASTDICLRQAEAPYELLRLESPTMRKMSEPELAKEQQNLSQPLKPVMSTMRARSVMDTHGKWDAYTYQYKRNKALKSDGENSLVPECLHWTVKEATAWLIEIGMGKYEETFLANEVDGSRLCNLNMNRMVKMGVQDWDDLKLISKELKVLTKRPSKSWFYSRETSRLPMDEIDLYLEFKHVHGEHSETTSFAQFLEENIDTLWSYPEKTLRYPGMIFQNNHTKKISTTLKF
ncbi:hypothetical protein BV898_07600 [Hypsibius exemplaris]|uniref:SAM domain-containing protein n=1 Tax=Hypsibius exemplaris TaxID=2072580 RepID=A0A1W0WT84_HYPEX|nr:hypothetical protein BV898_07600 [Hypsibius exemplaris]